MRKTSTMQMNGKIRIIPSSCSYVITCSIKFCMLSRVNTSHNQGVTDTIVKEIAQAGEYTDKDAIACKIFLFEHATFHLRISIFNSRCC